MQNLLAEPKDVLRFSLGAVIMTRGVSGLMKEYGLEPAHYLYRHAHGDWGDLTAEEKRENEKAVVRGGRICSAYNLPDALDTQLWVITEADRSVTRLLLPVELSEL